MPWPFEIRHYSPDDYEDLQALWDATGMGGRERGDNGPVIARTLENGGNLLVMIKDGSLIGSSWMTHDNRRMYIHHFAIHPDYQGRGWSKPLLEESLSFCQSVGFQVKLEVHRDNYRAIKLYKSFGFKELDGYGILIIRDI
jgi:ribosomal protein S18 acetylase RimI-like enzyme